MPPQTLEERKAHLAKGDQIRLARAAVKRQVFAIKSQQGSAAELARVLEEGGVTDALARATVGTVLHWPYKSMEARRRLWLSEIGATSTLRMERLTERQFQSMVAALRMSHDELTERRRERLAL